jgi:hypothetical protein
MPWCVWGRWWRSVERPCPTSGPLPRPSTPGRPAEEILGTLIAVAPISGIARVVLATPDVALSIGYDLDAAFEDLNHDQP